MTRGLRERSDNAHRTTTRAIPETQSDERVVREVSRTPLHAGLPAVFVLQRSPNLPDTPENTSNEHSALTVTVRAPSVATLFGEYI